ncbi:MAG TPA: sugar ABC transporter ATP-binding protein, partial [Actinomycetota bacterium]
VHQDLGLVNDLSITENVMLGRRYPRRRGGAINWKAARAAARDVIGRAGSSLDVRRAIGELGIADRTRVAIARALPENDEPSIIVLDEPTAALPARDVEQLFNTIRHLTEAGNAVVLVSHHLDEILGISDTITVLRDGVRVATVGVGEVDHDSLVQLIIGKELLKGGGRHEAVSHLGAPILTINELSADSVLDVNAVLHPGEIVGVAGLAGSGRELLGGMVTGRLSRRGTITVAGVDVPAAQPKASLAAGMAWISGERARYGTFSNMNLRANLTMGDLARHTRSGRVDVQSERAEVRDWIEKLGVVTRGPDVPITSLSGGNQQKVLVARALRLAPRVLVLDDPTAGIDVGAREQVHAIIEQYTTESMAVLLVSTDSDELARLCDRVLVMVRGVVAAELRRGIDLTAENIDHAQVAGIAA